MRQRSMKATDNQEFIASERWKCAKSPSGAHYWIIHFDQMTCKYCDFSKPTNTTPFGWTKSEEK